MTEKTYLCSVIVSEIFLSLGNAFMTFRDNLDGCQYRNNEHLEDMIMNILMQNNVISDPAYLPLIRELIGAAISEPALYADWTLDDEEFFSEQLHLDLSGYDEFSL